MRNLGNGSLLALLLVVGTVPAAAADNGRHRVRAELSGYNEVHFVTTQVCIPTGVNVTAGTPCVAPSFPALNSAALRGAVSTGARGSFRATVDGDTELIEYVLSYADLEGDVTQAHIHFGQQHTVGGIVVWLCQTEGTPAPPALAADTPTCPGPRQGTVSGTIGPEKVLAVTGQGIAADEFGELARAIRAGATYANVHSTVFGPGEIRGQIHDGGIGKVLDFLDRRND